MKVRTLFFSFCYLAVFTLFSVSSSTAAEPLWNQFRGPNHDNHSFSKDLLKEWPAEGPKLEKKIEGIGAGFGNVSFDEKRMYVMGDIGNDCCVLAFDRHTYEPLWKTPIADAGDVGRYVGPKSTPASNGKTVFAYGQYGDFASIDAETGKLNWCGSAPEELGGKYMGMWGYASSPIFVDDLVVIPVGGQDGTLIAFKVEDGQQAWRTKDLKDPAPYSSVMPAEIEGVKQLLLLSETCVSGINPKDGTLYWSIERRSNRNPAVCSDPIYKDGVVFVSSAYGMGSHGYKVTKNGDKFTAEEIYADRRQQNHHGGIVLVGDHVYFTSDRELVCMEIASGQIAWTNRCVEKGSVSYADGHLLVRSERSPNGTIALVEANPKEYVEKGRFNQPELSNQQKWTYPVIVEGKMYIRDQGTLLIYALK